MRIPQLTKAESIAVLPMLCEHVTKPEHCIRTYTSNPLMLVMPTFFFF
jgi:hypothetical protein